MKVTRRAGLLCALFFLSASLYAQSPAPAPSTAQETQARGYWVDPATGLTWSAKDSGKRGGGKKAVKYCRDLHLAGYSEWRLPNIEQLEDLFRGMGAVRPTRREGSSDFIYTNTDLHTKPGIELSYDRLWSSSPEIDISGHPSSAGFWYFNYQRGHRAMGFDDIAEGDTMVALCVRDTRPAPPPDKITALTAQSAPLTDPSTNLAWTAKDNGADVNLGEAMKACHDLRLAGKSDWTIPTLAELEYLYSAKNTAAKPTLTGNPWSSNSVEPKSGIRDVLEWYLNSQTGTPISDAASFKRNKRVLCVSGTAPPVTATTAPIASAMQLGYWLDPSTALMWKVTDNVTNSLFMSDEAQRSCSRLQLAQYKDWRLPTIDELQTIYDKTLNSPGETPRTDWTEPTVAVFHVKGNLFLSGLQLSSTLGTDDNNRPTPWMFDFQSGTRLKNSWPYEHGHEARVLCVRGPSK